LKRVISISLWLLLCIPFFTACVQEESTPNGTVEVEGVTDRVQIGITFDTFVLERWIRDRDVFVYTATQLGADVIVQNANGDVERQVAQIEEFVRQGKDAIVIVPVDSYALREVIGQVNNAGIPIISYDRLIQNVRTDLFITVNSRMVGMEMAAVLKEQLPDGGNVVMITGPEKDTNSRMVAEGFREALRRSNLIIIDEIMVRTWTPEYGLHAANEALDRHNQIDAIMSGNDGLAGFVVQALSQRQLAGTVLVTGQDADIEACQRVVEGTQVMTVYKPIEPLAARAAEFAVRLANGEELLEVNETIHNNVGDIPFFSLLPVAVTRENIEEVIIDSGFHLREDVFRNVMD